MDDPAEFFSRLEKVAVDSDLDLIDIVGIEPLNNRQAGGLRLQH